MSYITGTCFDGSVEFLFQLRSVMWPTAKISFLNVYDGLIIYTFIKILFIRSFFVTFRLIILYCKTLNLILQS